MFGSFALILLSWGCHRIGGIASDLNAIPALRQDVSNIKAEQARARREYHPPLKASE